MDEALSASQWTRKVPARLSGFAWTALATGILWLSLVSFPMTPGVDLDGSWQEVLMYAHAHGWQFGRQVIFTWGPWGFLCSQYHLGATGAWAKIVWETLGKLLLAWGLVWLTRSLAPWRRIAFVAALVLFHGFFFDITLFLLFVLAVVVGLMRRETSLVEHCVWVAVLAFLSQFKFTYMVLTMAGVCASVALWALRRDWRRACGTAIGYGVALLLAWLAAGQNPDNLYPYIRRSLEVTAGYGDAMGLDETWPVFGWGVAVGAACIFFVWRTWKAQADRGYALCAAGFAALVWLVMWKEAFTRADGHVNGLFAYTLIASLCLPGLFFARSRFHWFELAPALCLAGVWAADPDMLTYAPKIAVLTLVQNARAVCRVGRFPDEWQWDYAAACARADLPKIRRAVGGASVDVFDFNQGAALLNGLNFTPRPVFQGYTAYTPALEGWNLRFYQSAAAPSFLLEMFDNIDNRYFSIDDASLFAALPLGYEPVMEEGGYWLLRKKAAIPPGRLERRLLGERTLRLGEEYPLPAAHDHAVWLQAELGMNMLGRVRALLYKPPAVSLTVTDDAGRESTWRVLPRVAADGFLLEPFLESGSDFAALLRGRGRVWLRSLRFEAPADQAEFWRDITVHVFELPQLPMLHEGIFARVVEAGIVDRQPLEIQSPAGPQEIFSVGTGRAMLLHAPGEIELAVPAGAREFVGSFGIRDGAFTGEARTAGVEFVVEGTWADGRREALWRRYLDPLRQPSDRGLQRFEFALPRVAPDRLTLRTQPGPTGDNRWAWSYVTGLHFSDGAGR